MTRVQKSLIDDLINKDCEYKEVYTFLATIKVNRNIYYNVSSIIFFILDDSIKFMLLFEDRTSGIYNLQNDTLSLVPQRKRV